MNHTRGATSQPGSNVLPLSSREPWPSALPRQATLWTGAAAIAALANASTLTAKLARLAGLDSDLDQTPDVLAHWHDHQEWPERPLRVGLVSPGAWSDRLTSAPSVTSTQWFTIPAEHADDALTTLRLDVVIAPTPEGGLILRSPEHPDREASWFDWGFARPLSYPSVFPARLDAANVTLPLSPADEDPALVRLLAEALGTLSRHESRLDLTDRLLGRRPLLLSRASTDTVSEYAPVTDLVSSIASRLAQHLASFRTGAVPTPAERAAARFVGAWAASWPIEAEPDARREAIETAARVCPDEADTMLRLAAVRLGCLDDTLGLEAITRATRLIQPDRIVAHADPAAFLSAELQAGQPGPWTTGRLAVGVCILAATVDLDQLPFFRDDLMDDLRHSPMLVGREQDQHLILQALRGIELSRRSTERGLPSPTPTNTRRAEAPAAPKRRRNTPTEPTTQRATPAKGSKVKPTQSKRAQPTRTKTERAKTRKAGSNEPPNQRAA